MDVEVHRNYEEIIFENMNFELNDFFLDLQ
jgi:hypothetical protein